MKKILPFIILFSSLYAFDLGKCASCHMDKLQHKFTKKELQAKLYEFRKSTIMPMSKIANKLTDEEIKKASIMYGGK
jgi:cytochrome c553